MGKQVTFSQYLARRPIMPGSRTKAWVPTECPPRVGWVVGVRWVQTGRRVEKYGVSRDGFETRSYRFREIASRTLCYLVTPYPTMKPIRVPPEAVEVLSEPVDVNLWTEEDRKWMSEESKLWPRDEKGRFSK